MIGRIQSRGIFEVKAIEFEGSVLLSYDAIPSVKFDERK
jgi:hypothetical protein